MKGVHNLCVMFGDGRLLLELHSIIIKKGGLVKGMDLRKLYIPYVLECGFGTKGGDKGCMTSWHTAAHFVHWLGQLARSEGMPL